MKCGDTQGNVTIDVQYFQQQKVTQSAGGGKRYRIFADNNNFIVHSKGNAVTEFPCVSLL